MFGENYYCGDESKNFKHYDKGDKVSVSLTYNVNTHTLKSISKLEIIENSRGIKGDVNSDKKFDIADVVLLQKWIIGVPDVKLANWKSADFYDNDKFDILDLYLMKQELFNK